jgi:riboflavin biosynthesis pyrimidine reductase
MRPLIHINFATDEVGRDICLAGLPATVSCDSDWKRVHTLREKYDAVAVGGRTWKIDQPRLNVRAERLGRQPRRQPAKVVFAGRHACVIERAETPVFIVGSLACGAPGVTSISSSGYRLTEPLEMLWSLGIRSMLVEGGPTLISSFLAQSLTDRLTVFVRSKSKRSAALYARRALPGLPTLAGVERCGEGLILTFDCRFVTLSGGEACWASQSATIA